MKYQDYTRHVYNKLSPRKKHELFYYSLFDPSGWEELSMPPLKTIQEELPKKVVNLIRRATKHQSVRSKIKRKENFLRNFVYAGKLCHFTLAAALKGKRVNARPSQRFPDLVIKGREEIGLEVKRLVSCTNLKERIDDEVVKPLKDGKWRQKIKLLLLFPQLEKENPDRIQRIIDGFYLIKEYVKHKFDVEIGILCVCVEKEYHEDSQYSFDKIIDKLSKWIPTQN